MTYQLAPEIDAIPLSSELLAISERIARKDHTIWGEKSEAPTRMGWIDLPERSRALLPRLDSLCVQARESKISEIVLSGMGGSSLAPEVIAKSYQSTTIRSLTVLDSTEPGFVRSVIDRDLKEVLFLVSSKSGTTIETLSHLAVIETALQSQGLDSREHIVVITDPDSSLEQRARKSQWPLLHGQSDVGGRYSALSAFGLVPAALIGVDASLLLDDAAEMLDQIHEPAVKIATFLASHRYLYFTDSKGDLPGLADWIEQLIAESTGKMGKGLLPIAIANSESTSGHLTIDLSTIIKAPLGSHFILWEWVTALLGYSFAVDPFDQPDVQSTKARTLDALQEKERSDSQGDSTASATSLEQINLALDQAMDEREYLVICAYLDPKRDHDAIALRGLLERRFTRPVAFGWGPRFLHSTGQFHKGGPKTGVFLSLTIEPEMDLHIPGKDFGFSRLIRAQAEGDRRALLESGGRVVSIHLRDRDELSRLIEILGGEVRD